MIPLPPGVQELPLPECARAARVFLADLNALPPPEALVADLEGAERARASTFLVAHARASFIRRRWLRHTLVAGAHGLPRSGLRIESDRLGRPSVAYPDQLRALALSTSSAGRYALVAWRLSHSIGVDIAQVDGALATKDAADVFMSPCEQANWSSSPDAAGFFRLWARKEAGLKALGTGFATDPTSINASGSALKSMMVQLSMTILLTDLPMMPGLVGAMALADHPPEGAGQVR
jgi:4'-phosphopantetheinyl transferase